MATVVQPSPSPVSHNTHYPPQAVAAQTAVAGPAVEPVFWGDRLAFNVCLACGLLVGGIQVFNLLSCLWHGGGR